MLRTRAALAAAAAAAVAAVGGSLGAAQAASGTTGTTGTTGATGATAVATPVAPVASITVNGAGFVTVDSNAPQATFHADYLAALSDALADAKAKAGALATQSGDTLGAMTTISEQTNDGMSCDGPVMFAEGRAKGAPSVVPSSHRKPKSKPKKVTLHIADAGPTSCTIEADVTASYAAS